MHSPRQLDDAELDSGDDEGRDDRAQQDDEEQQQQFEDHEMLSMDVEVARQPVPEPSDGEVGILNHSSLYLILTKSDVPSQGARIHVHRVRALASHNVPASENRSPL